MYNGPQNFQDLINETVLNEDLDALQTSVEGLDTRVTSNSGLITQNQTDIAINSTASSTNATGVAFNTTVNTQQAVDITSLENTRLKKDGTILLDAGYTPSSQYGLVSKSYVDSQAGDYLPLAGGQMFGVIDMNNSTIQGLPVPLASLDACRYLEVESETTRAQVAEGANSADIITASGNIVTNAGNITIN
jgi:hypothetical protein